MEIFFTLFFAFSGIGLLMFFAIRHDIKQRKKFFEDLTVSIANGYFSALRAFHECNKGD